MSSEYRPGSFERQEMQATRIPFAPVIEVERAEAMNLVAEQALAPGGLSEAVLFYDEQLSPKARYVVRRLENRWIFDLVYENKLVAELALAMTQDELDIHHRLVRSQDLGVNGSLFLQKAEAYLGFLRKKGWVPDVPLSMSVAQVPVVHWALKNGFVFQEEKDQQFFERLLKGEESGYCVDGVDLPNERGVIREGYIVQRSIYEGWRRGVSHIGPKDDVPVPLGSLSMRLKLIKYQW